MREIQVRRLLITAVLLAMASSLQAQGPIDSVHNWARFAPGSWKHVRVTIEELAEDGSVTTRTSKETRTSLVEISDGGYTLQADVTTIVAGKRFRGEPATLRRGLNGEIGKETSEMKELGTGKLTIAGRQYPTVIQQVIIKGDSSTRTSTIFRSADTRQMLRTETSSSNHQGQKNYDVLVEVLATEMPYPVISEIHPTTHVRSVQRHASGEEKITLEVQSQRIPGGVVSHTSKTLDKSGRSVRRSTLELLGYQVLERTTTETKPKRSGLFPGRRKKRDR